MAPQFLAFILCIRGRVVLATPCLSLGRFRVTKQVKPERGTLRLNCGFLGMLGIGVLALGTVPGCSSDNDDGVPDNDDGVPSDTDGPARADGVPIDTDKPAGSGEVPSDTDPSCNGPADGCETCGAVSLGLSCDLYCDGTVGLGDPKLCPDSSPQVWCVCSGAFEGGDCCYNKK